jgi:hypothetical protein
MRRPIAAMALTAAVLVAACSADPYPLPSGPPHVTQRSPAAVGEPARAILIYLQVRPGDRIELLDASAIGSIEGASVRFVLSRPVIKPNGDRVIGDTFEDLGGTTVEAVTASPGPDNTVGIGAVLTASKPGRFEITGVRLRYRINGGGEQTGEGTDVAWTVCADDPAPADCPAS